MPDLTTVNRKTLAATRYLKIKEAGTVQELCEEFGISKPTLLNWVADYLKQQNAPADTGAGDPAEQTAAGIPTTIPPATTVTSQVNL